LTTSTISLGHWTYDRAGVRDHPAMASFGLCDTCRHQRLVRTGRGSVFTMCLKSREDPAFPKYPRVPVEACTGYERRPEERS
jgi:hypothetical protein